MRQSSSIVIFGGLITVFLLSMGDLLFQWHSKEITLLFPLFIVYLAVNSLIKRNPI
jgi:hypothetical protein